METDEFGTVLFYCSISLSEARLNEVRITRDRFNSTVAEPSGFNSKARGGHVSDSHLLSYSKPRGCLSRHCITLESYCFLYCDWGWSRIATPDIILNYVWSYCAQRVDFIWSP